jgi:hypothetical protein
MGNGLFEVSDLGPETSVSTRNWAEAGVKVMVVCAGIGDLTAEATRD